MKRTPKQKPRRVFVITGDSESGDHYLKVLASHPSVDHLSALAHSWDCSPTKDGPGYDGSYVHIKVLQENVEDVKDATN